MRPKPGKGTWVAAIEKGPAFDEAGPKVQRIPAAQRIVGITKSAPCLMPEGQREVMVFVFV